MSYEPKTYRKAGGDTFVVASGGEIEVESGGSIGIESGGAIDVESGGAFKVAGTDKATVLGNVLGISATTIDGSTGKKACQANGVTLITGGTGIADLTLAAPSEGAVAIIRVASLSSGDVVVTTADGVTFDGTNNTATFDAADEALMLVYSSATAWAVALNVGSVALSAVE